MSRRKDEGVLKVWFIQREEGDEGFLKENAMNDVDSGVRATAPA